MVYANIRTIGQSYVIKQSKIELYCLFFKIYTIRDLYSNDKSLNYRRTLNLYLICANQLQLLDK